MSGLFLQSPHTAIASDCVGREDVCVPASKKLEKTVPPQKDGDGDTKGGPIQCLSSCPHYRWCVRMCGGLLGWICRQEFFGHAHCVYN